MSRLPQGRGDRLPAAPALGLSWEGRPLELLAATAPLVNVIEVIPDALLGPAGDIEISHLRALDEFAEHTPLTYHGVGLSIGSVEGWNESYFRLLDRLLAWREPLWHSEHLGFTQVAGRPLATMPALPATPEALDLVVPRARCVRERYGLEFMLEHVASPLARPGAESLATFLNSVAAETGSRLLLDLHNLECDVNNGLLNLEEFIAELDWSRVGEIHLAGGVWHDGFHLDVHARLLAPSTLRLLELALPRAVNLELVVFEVLAGAVDRLGIPAIQQQLRAVRAVMTGRAAPVAT